MLLLQAFLALLVAALLAAPAATAAEDPYPRDDVLRVNDVWSIGTHNSYHLISPVWPPNAVPHDYDYEHAPLDVQLDEQGVRKFELDIYWDLTGYFRVHHVTYFDAESSCPTLTGCLEILRDWSLAHRGHVPIFVFVEPKGVFDPDNPTTIDDGPICDPPERTPCHYDELDAEIRSVLAPPGGPDLLVTPDEVRGARATLREAVLEDGWPSLRDARGRFVMVMLDGGEDRDAYAAGEPVLAGRAMFVASAPDRDDAAVMLRDDPVSGQIAIQDLVSQGYVVRTRADVLDDAQANDPTRRDAALTSGAQVISTDYPVPEILGNGYFAAIPGGTPSSCNPVTTAGVECTPLDIENPAALVPEPSAPALGLAAVAWLARRRRGA